MPDHFSYVPVDPDTREVHDVGANIDTTACGRILPWVRSIMFIKSTDPHCPKCYPKG